MYMQLLFYSRQVLVDVLRPSTDGCGHMLGAAGENRSGWFPKRSAVIAWDVTIRGVSNARVHDDAHELCRGAA